MATATMPPPLSSSKEPRRSNRRSLPSNSTNTSKSSGSPSPDAQAGPSHKEAEQSASSSRPAPAQASTNGRSRRKADKDEEIVEERPQRTSAAASKRGGKRGGKTKAKQSELDVEHISAKTKDSLPETPLDDLAAEEDASVTRCVCGVLDEDADTGEFMIQCETCKVWQHGPCMGFPSEAAAPQGDYYCEECRPQDHPEIIRKLQRKQRQGSSHPISHRATSRSSRSHSPSHLLKPSRRRNTMNSRDADILQEVLDASMAEVSAGADANVATVGASEIVEGVIETVVGGRKKRKRVTEEIVVQKRKRSLSSASEQPVAVGVLETHADAPASVEETNWPLPPPPPKAPSGRVKRGNKAKSTMESSVNGDAEDGTHPNSKKHPNQYTYRGRGGASNSHRRVPPTNTFTPVNGDYGSRRGGHSGSHHPGTPGGSGLGAGPSRLHHAQVVAQQTLLTTWSLPDYLSHLHTILPTEVPTPLLVRAPRIGLDEEHDSGTLQERGVKVKWPAKRMSVADMNKRVRALSEWVGREQAAASERGRRKNALEAAVPESKPQEISVEVRTLASAERPKEPSPDEAKAVQDVSSVIADAVANSQEPTTTGASKKFSSDLQKQSLTEKGSGHGEEGVVVSSAPPIGGDRMNGGRQETAKMMEELMEDLINFQERFGPGAKGRTKERVVRTVAIPV